MQFSDILGQDAAIQILKRAIEHHHVAHAYLFSGPEGVGKQAAAVAMATYLNCQQPSGATDSCGTCPSCVQIAAGSHPDVLLLEPDEKDSIKIEPIRVLIGKLALQSYESTYKVAIINDAHKMTTEAANALLKTLEEPAENTVFILVSSAFQNLPETILSRCQQVMFQPLPAPVIKDILMAKHPEFRSRIGVASALAGGSVSMALDLLADEDFSGRRQEFCEILLNLAEKPTSDILLWCEKWKKDRKTVGRFLDLGQVWYHDLLTLSITDKTDYLVNQDYMAELSRLSPQTAKMMAVLDIFQKGTVQLRHNVTPDLILTMVLLKTRRILSAQ